MRRIWPPETQTDESVVFSEIPHLQDWCAYFEVNFGDRAQAGHFVRHYGLRFPRAGGTVRGNVAWMTLRIGAADEQEAALLAALTVRIAADEKANLAAPQTAVLHHVDEVERGFSALQEKLREEREDLMRYADALGIRRRITSPASRAAEPALGYPDRVGRPALAPGL